MQTPVPGIDGLTVSDTRPRRVEYLGQECPRLSRSERLCDLDTSYRGCVLDSKETWRTPIGVVERAYWARGPGLERCGVEWRIVPEAEIEAAQRRFVAASKELAIARAALEALVGKSA